MKKYIAKIITVLALTNCGHVGDIHQSTAIQCSHIHPDCGNSTVEVSEGLKKHVNYAEYKLGISINYDVVFADIEDPTINAQCWRTNTKQPLTILIDKLSWSEMDSDAKRHVIFHEIGHCSYGLDHTSIIGTVMYYSMTNTGLKGRYKEAQRQFIELYNTYGGAIPLN